MGKKSITLTTEEIQKIVRGTAEAAEMAKLLPQGAWEEIPADESLTPLDVIEQCSETNVDICCDGTYLVKPEDILEAVSKFRREHSKVQEVLTWYKLLSEELSIFLEPSDVFSWDYGYAGPDYEFPKTDKDALAFTRDLLDDLDVVIEDLLDEAAPGAELRIGETSGNGAAFSVEDAGIQGGRGAAVELIELKEAEEFLRGYLQRHDYFARQLSGKSTTSARQVNDNCQAPTRQLSGAEAAGAEAAEGTLADDTEAGARASAEAEGTRARDDDYPEFMKERYLEHFPEERLEKASDEEKARYVDYINELADKGNETALRERLYGYYSGNAVFPQNFYQARDDAEKLFAATHDPVIANTLGYIYYYGRCNQGKGEYEKAFQHFSYGAANGLIESIYKLSDMYRNGYGVIQSAETAFHLVYMLYQESLEAFEAGNRGKLADVALRVGSMTLHGEGTDCSPERAIRYLLQAQFAVKERAKEHYYGDNVVAANIQRMLKEAKGILPSRKNEGRAPESEAAFFLKLFAQNYRVTWQARQLKGGGWSVAFARKAKHGEQKAKKVFTIVSPLYYCGFTSKLSGSIPPQKKAMPLKGTADDFSMEWGKDGAPVWIFYYDGKQVLRIVGEIEWKIPRPAKHSGEKVRLATIAFSPQGRHYDYICEDPQVKEGDQVIVQGYDGPTKVTVLGITLVDVEDLLLPKERYKKVVGKV